MDPRVEQPIAFQLSEQTQADKPREPKMGMLSLLPHELLLKVLRYLSLNDFKLVPAACKTLNSVSQDNEIWKPLVLKKLDPDLIPPGVLSYRSFLKDFLTRNPARAAVCTYELFHIVINKDLIPDRSFIPGEANFELVRFMLGHIEDLAVRLKIDTKAHIPAQTDFFNENLSEFDIKGEGAYPAEIFWIATAILNYPNIAHPWVIARGNVISYDLKTKAHYLYVKFNELLVEIRKEPLSIDQKVKTDDSENSAIISDEEPTLKPEESNRTPDDRIFEIEGNQSQDAQLPAQNGVPSNQMETFEDTEKASINSLKEHFVLFKSAWEDFIYQLVKEQQGNKSWQQIGLNGGRFIEAGNLNSLYQLKSFEHKRKWSKHYFTILERMFSNLSQRKNLIGFREKFMNLTIAQLAKAEKRDQFIGEVMRIFRHMKEELPQ